MHFKCVRQPRSLRTRLLRDFILGMVLSATLVGLVVLVFASSFSQYLLRAGIEKYTAAIARHVRFDEAGLPVGVDENRIGSWVLTGLGEETHLRILDAQGAVVYAPDGSTRPLSASPPGEGDVGQAFALRRKGVDMHASTDVVEHGGRRWFVQFAASDRLVMRVRQTVGVSALTQVIAAVCVIFSVIFFITTSLTMRRALAPLRAASAAAQRISPRTLDERLDVGSQAVEIGPLVQAFNAALDRLQHGFRTQQDFLATAAHELKTPLALIRAQLEVGYGSERTKLQLQQDVDRIGRQVQQLLVLAEVSEPENYRLETVDPRGTVHEAVQFMSRVADHHGVVLRLNMEGDAGAWRVDRGALFTLVKNLLENAIQHSPPTGTVSLHVDRLGLVVTDQGPGVPPGDLPRIFERFWRSAARRDQGAGLGLAICSEIAQAHGWRLSASCPQQGLEVRVKRGVPDEEAVRPA